jgi:6-pyruvoyl-tetrahydropterin synthase
MILASN